MIVILILMSLFFFVFFPLSFSQSYFGALQDLKFPFIYVSFSLLISFSIHFFFFFFFFFKFVCIMQFSCIYISFIHSLFCILYAVSLFLSHFLDFTYFLVHSLFEFFSSKSIKFFFFFLSDVQNI